MDYILLLQHIYFSLSKEALSQRMGLSSMHYQRAYLPIVSITEGTLTTTLLK